MNLTFDLELPFKLPIEDGYRLISAYSGAEFSSIFNTYKKTTTVEGQEEYPQEEVLTYITITYIPSEDICEGLQIDELQKQTITHSLDYVNRMLDAMRSKFGLDYIFNLTIADLPMDIVISIGEDNYLYLTQPQELLRDTDTNMSKAQINEAISLLKTWEDYPEIYLVEKFFDSAKSHLYKEQFIDTIIDLQTSFEIFIRNTHKLILIKQGFTEEDIDGRTLIPFRNVIEQHIGPKYLNVEMKFIDANKGPINQWYEDLYLLRNSIVHKGLINVTGDQAYKAYDSYVKARNYISDKLVENNYLNPGGKVDLTLFKKNTKGSIDTEKVFAKLKELGIVEEDIDSKVPTDKS